jgi:hypothetical protein
VADSTLRVDLTPEERDTIVAALAFHRMDGTNDALITRLRTLEENH